MMVGMKQPKIAAINVKYVVVVVFVVVVRYGNTSIIEFFI